MGLIRFLLVLWQNLRDPITVLLAWSVMEIICSVVKETPAWLLRQVLAPTLRSWRELAYLQGLVHDERFAQWRSRPHRYVALRAVKEVGGETSTKLSRDLAPCSLIGSLQGCLKRRESVLVLGDPGAGKTTAFEALTYQLARMAYRRSLFTWFLWLVGTAVLVLWYPPAALVWLALVPQALFRARLFVTPFFIELRAFFEDNARQLLSETLEATLGDAALLGTRGRYLFLLDGTNEIHRDQAARFFETWPKQRSMPLTFFSSRRGEKPALEVTVTLEVCELDDDGVTDYLRVYRREKARQKRRARRVTNLDVGVDLAELQDRGLLTPGGVGRNPYWLRMLALSGLRTRNRGALFLSFARDLIQREIEAKPEERKRKPEWRTVPTNVEMDALAGLALAMHQEHQIGFEGEEGWVRGREAIRATLGDRSETADDVLSEAEAATLIRQQYKERIEFSHHLVQEFFAAYALRSQERWGEAVAHCADSWWWQTLFLLSGLTAALQAGGSPENWTAFVHSVLGDVESDECLFVAVALPRSVESPEAGTCEAVKVVFIGRVHAPPSDSQRYSAQQLGRVLGDEAIEAFAPLLEGPSCQDRISGAALLCALENRRANEVLLTRLGGEYADVMTAVGAPAVAYLLDALLKHDHWRGRREAAIALGDLDDERAVEPLIGALKDDNWAVRQAAAAALAELGDKQAVEPLIGALKDDNWAVRQAAARALGKLGDARTVWPLIAALGDRNEDVQWSVIQAMRGVSSTWMEPLVAALMTDNADMRRGVIIALGELGDERVVEPLIAALFDKDWSVRERAAIALGNLADERAVEPLIAVLGDEGEDEYVRVGATYALRKITRHDFGQDPIAWRAWWREQRDCRDDPTE